MIVLIIMLPHQSVIFFYTRLNTENLMPNICHRKTHGYTGLTPKYIYNSSET